MENLQIHSAIMKNPFIKALLLYRKSTVARLPRSLGCQDSIGWGGEGCVWVGWGGEWEMNMMDQDDGSMRL